MIWPVCKRNSLFYPRRLCCAGCGLERINNGLREIAFYDGAQARIARLPAEPPPRTDSDAWLKGYKQAGIDFFGEKAEKVKKQTKQRGLWE